MAKITLKQREIVNETLPEVCIHCGEPSHAVKDKKFSYTPQWVSFLIIFGALPAIIASAITTKRMTMPIHLCEVHQNYWRKRAMMMWLPFLGVLLFGIGSFAYVQSVQDQGNQDKSLAGMICGGGVVVGLVWLIYVIISQNMGIRATEITDRSMTLTHVSEAYVDAVYEERELLKEMSAGTKRRLRDEGDGDDERPRKRKARRRDDDDEYDDE